MLQRAHRQGRPMNTTTTLADALDGMPDWAALVEAVSDWSLRNGESPEQWASTAANIAALFAAEAEAAA